MIGFNGGLIGKEKTPTASVATGVFTLWGQLTQRRKLAWPVVGDPDFGSVSLLLHGNGANGSTSITDSSANNFTVSVVGNAQISTSQSKYGGSSIYLDGNGDYLSLAYNSAFDFGTGDFTVECWYRRVGDSTGGSATDYEAVIGSNAAGVPRWTIYLRRSTKNITWFGDDSTIRETSGASLSNDTWYHIAWCRSGTSLKGFIDGVERYSATTSTSFNTSASGLRIGYDLDANRQSYCYLDDLRITKGVARYTTGFTPPTAQLPS